MAVGTPFEPVELGRIEAGERPLASPELEVVLGAYDVALSDLVPPRGQVVLDLESGRLLVADAAVHLDREPTAEEVLSAYLSLVWSLRRARPGTPIVLRELDLRVLARGLDLARPEVEARLHTLMVEPVAKVQPARSGRRRRRRRLALLVGAVVAVGAAAVGVLVRRDADPAPDPPTASSTVPPAELIPPAVAERDPGADGG
ncbi:MAG TPA: hypothetical protein VIY72_09835 [Acidimicrobiales bacterium]